MHDRPDNRAARNPSLATVMAPLIVLEDPALQNRLARFEVLAGGRQVESVQAAEGIEIRDCEGSTGCVEDLQMASVRKRSSSGGLDAYSRTDAPSPPSAATPSSAKSQSPDLGSRREIVRYLVLRDTGYRCSQL